MHPHPNQLTLVVDGVSTWVPARTGSISNVAPLVLRVKSTAGHDQYLATWTSSFVAKR